MTRKLGTIVKLKNRRQAAACDRYRFDHTDYSQTWKRERWFDGQAFVRAIVDHRYDSHRSAAGEAVGDEIEQQRSLG
jgi:hypothetical protein